MDPKRLVAEKAVSYIENGMIVGLGTGSTANEAIREIGKRVAGGLRIKAVASSLKSEDLAKTSGIPIVPLSGITQIDIYIDGADEVNHDHYLIKGGGASLLREKILAYNSKKFLVIVDESKLVDQLGRFPLPVEVTPFAANLTLKHLIALGCSAGIRQKDQQHYVTDNGNLIADCSFGKITEPSILHNKIKSIPGVVETGIFDNSMVTSIIVGYSNGTIKELTKNS